MVGGDGGDRVATDPSGAVLVGVAGALNRAADLEGVAGAIFDQVAAALGAGTVGLWLLDPARGVLRVAGSVGYRAEALAHVSEIALDDALPGADALRWGVPNRMEAGVALPLLARGRALGVLAFAFSEARDFTAAETVVLGAVSEQC